MKQEISQKNTEMGSSKRDESSKKSTIGKSSTTREKDDEREKILLRIQELEDELNEVEQVSTI